MKVAVRKTYPARAEAVAKKKGFKGDPKKGLTQASEWEVSRVRAYLAGEPPNTPGLIRIYTAWEELEEVNDFRTGKPFHVKFDSAKVLPLGNPKADKDEILRAIPITEPMVKWLGKCVAFSKEAVKQLNSVKGLLKQSEGVEMRAGSISEFLSLYLQAEAREDVVQERIKGLE